MNIDTYTTNNAIKNLALLEQHLKEFSQAPIFCAECCAKHLYLIEGLSQECIGVCELGESVWHKLADWASKKRDEIPNLTQDGAEMMAGEARIFRKELEMFIMTCDSEGCSIPSLGHLENLSKKGHLIR